ncbi:MAG: restriction endonuclease [Lachnospiraceae bacterium]|nr:restriction endonuclease [Lachnospiraceae bacterium]
MTAAIIYTTLIFALFAGIWFYLFREKRHQWYIRRAKQIYHKINYGNNGYSPAQLLMYLRHINPYVFEELLLYAFQCKGYKIIRNKRYSGDGGIDGQVVIDGYRIPIQAKRYASYIKRGHIAAFAHIIEQKRKPYGLFIHTGRTGKTSGTTSYPTVRIISGRRLLDLLYKDRTFTHPPNTPERGIEQQGNSENIN